MVTGNRLLPLGSCIAAKPITTGMPTTQPSGRSGERNIVGRTDSEPEGLGHEDEDDDMVAREEALESAGEVD